MMKHIIPGYNFQNFVRKISRARDNNLVQVITRVSGFKENPPVWTSGVGGDKQEKHFELMLTGFLYLLYLDYLIYLSFKILVVIASFVR